MRRTAPQVISLIAMLAGIALFGATLLLIDWRETRDTLARLGRALPLVLLPSIAWHLLRTAGWSVCFPADQHPGFWRVFRVRLAADGVAYFTVRGVASEPLRVLLLLDRTPAAVSAAASVLERIVMGIVSVTLVGLCSGVAVASGTVPSDWDGVFQTIAFAAVGVLVLTLLLFSRTGRYLGPLFAAVHRLTGWTWTGGRVVTFVSQVEAICLDLARTDWSRLRSLVLLGIACFALMAIEVWLVFWAIGSTVSLFASAVIETFTRTASILGGAIPANLGALEASNVMVVNALGLTGAGSLALARRLRSLLWAALGLALYPRDAIRRRAAVS